MNVIQPSRGPLAEPSAYRLTVDAYHRMIEIGIFGEDDHVELIEGELRAMPPINAGHAGKNKRLNQLFSQRARGQAIVAVQDPLVLPEHSEPEPDLMLLRPRADFYEHGNPGPADTLLVVEIADSSLSYDRNTKVPLYAAHGVPEVWLIDLRQRRVEVYRDPGPVGYRLILRPDPDQAIAPLLLPELLIQVAEFWS
ncbi:MAG TPA: Uma2 family endonuclease [Lamprocystis sp. (in: g-proteobacteria)]|nr:Uma2 family endonuclease [Lamprocystis sp. (in: g-proteobacteria)]